MFGSESYLDHLASLGSQDALMLDLNGRLLEWEDNLPPSLQVNLGQEGFFQSRETSHPHALLLQ
jgi:hypothetical protein